MMRKWAMVAVATAVVFSPAVQMPNRRARKAQEQGCRKSLSARKGSARCDRRAGQQLVAGARPRQPRNRDQIVRDEVGAASAWSDRNKGLANRNIERALADSGELQRAPTSAAAR